MGDIGEKIDRFIEVVERDDPPTSATVRRICYTGEDVEPDPYSNLSREREAATWVVTHVNVAGPARAALIRYIAAIDKILRTTSAKDTDG